MEENPITSNYSPSPLIIRDDSPMKIMTPKSVVVVENGKRRKQKKNEKK